MSKRIIHAPRGNKLTCKNWQIEAPYRMIQNNLDPDVAENPDELVVYGEREKRREIGNVMMRFSIR